MFWSHLGPSANHYVLPLDLTNLLHLILLYVCFISFIKRIFFASDSTFFFQFLILAGNYWKLIQLFHKFLNFISFTVFKSTNYLILETNTNVSNFMKLIMP